jgi:spore coat polysaccharide biosynthesis protein SpsF
MKTIVIIQARMGSSRLPGKVLLPLGDSCVLDYAVSRCRLIHGVTEVVVATSTLPADDRISEWCMSRGVRFFRGSEEDVLTRYYECARHYEPDYVIRVTSDCPFVDYDFGGAMLQAMMDSPSDIVVLDGSLIPRGLTMEVISFGALKQAYERGTEPRHREHVTTYIYEYADRFSKTVIEVPEHLRYPKLRITLDTEEDYALCKAVADVFAGNREVPSGEVVEYLLLHPEVAVLNAHIQQKPVI